MLARMVFQHGGDRAVRGMQHGLRTSLQSQRHVGDGHSRFAELRERRVGIHVCHVVRRQQRKRQRAGARVPVILSVHLAVEYQCVLRQVRVRQIEAAGVGNVVMRRIDADRARRPVAFVKMLADRQADAARTVSGVDQHVAAAKARDQRAALVDDGAHADAGRLCTAQDLARARHDVLHRVRFPDHLRVLRGIEQQRLHLLVIRGRTDAPERDARQKVRLDEFFEGPFKDHVDRPFGHQLQQIPQLRLHAVIAQEHIEQAFVVDVQRFVAAEHFPEDLRPAVSGRIHQHAVQIVLAAVGVQIAQQHVAAVACAGNAHLVAAGQRLHVLNERVQILRDIDGAHAPVVLEHERPLAADARGGFLEHHRTVRHAPQHPALFQRVIGAFFGLGDQSRNVVMGRAVRIDADRLGDLRHHRGADLANVVEISARQTRQDGGTVLQERAEESVHWEPDDLLFRRSLVAHQRVFQNTRHQDHGIGFFFQYRRRGGSSDRRRADEQRGAQDKSEQFFHIIAPFRVYPYCTKFRAALQVPVCRFLLKRDQNT